MTCVLCCWQVAACVAASLGTLSGGAIMGWTAGTLPSLQQDPDMPMGTMETALMVVIVGLGAIVGSPIAGRTIDWVGRRTTIILVYPVLVAAWLLMALAPLLPLVLLGRALCGLMTPFLFSAVSVYNSEIPEARLRGRLGTMSSFFITLGVLLSYVAGALLPWRHSCYVCAAPALLGTAALIPMPESPYWFMLKNRRSDAEKALRWLRGPHCDINQDLENIATKLKAVGTKVEYRELLRPRTRRPFFIALFTMTLQQASGGNILMIYTGTIFLSAGVEDYHMAIVYTGLMQLLGTSVSVILMDRVERRAMLVASVSTLGVFTILLGVYYYLKTVVGVVWPQAVPLVAVLMAVLGYSFGCRTIPWLTSSELFNTTIRSTASTVCFFYNRLLSVIILQSYPFMEEAVGAHTVFFFFGGLCILFGLLAILIIPKSKGKSLEQIQDYFEEKSLKSSNDKDKTTACSTQKTEGGKTACQVDDRTRGEWMVLLLGRCEETTEEMIVVVKQFLQLDTILVRSSRFKGLAYEEKATCNIKIR
ncbi:Facilitated trehalose transporter Tret1 [Chionoecetes opilio]|uniref:Facilitated trehalose transporter Tret1 n=1 Tax=Chionoecetes opilio TaxID=41210 RepID=A0A8J8WEP0_CHIOP|nr:Facilitated trehalose transporter Tret1 [Chionoecetes opilio]